MNNKQKRKLEILAIGLGVLLVILLAISLILNCAGKSVHQNTNVQARSPVIISEILASNKQAVRDPMGTYSDYVELYNTGTDTVNISGYGLSDDEVSVWVFPEGTILKPNEYLVIWCSGSATGLSNVNRGRLKSVSARKQAP